jgi:hypothetical protein
MELRYRIDTALENLNTALSMGDRHRNYYMTRALSHLYVTTGT